MEQKKIRIVGVAGSLRKNSYNAAVLRAAREFLPEHVKMETVEIGDLPFFNEDVESAGLPASVVAFKAKLASADALLIATPEYNYGIPPVLKNAIDWASRGESALYGKPVGIVSASPSMLGGARAQYQLRQICVSVNLLPINKPEVFIAAAYDKFDETGRLTDPMARDFLSKLVAELIKTLR